MSTAAPITAVTVITDVDELTEIAATYATMADELAGLVEVSQDAHTIPARIITERLAALHVELDELTASTPPRARLVRLVNDVDELRTFIAGIDVPLMTSALVTPLEELHAALIDQVSIRSWQVTA